MILTANTSSTLLSLFDDVVLHLREAQLNLADLPSERSKSIQDTIQKNINSLKEHAEIIQPNVTNPSELKLTSNSEFLQMIGRHDQEPEMKRTNKSSKKSRVVNEEEEWVESVANVENGESLTATQKLKSEYLMLKNSRSVSQKSVEKYKEIEQRLKSVQFNAEMLAFVDVCSRSPELVRSNFL